jgi:DNA end-binding protein Ku
MARPIWTGSISFGLVSIPVEMITVVHERTVQFHMLTKDGTCRLRRKLVCPETGKEYDFNQTARGVEIGPEDYVLVDQKEIDRLKPEKGRSLDIVQFVDVRAVDPVCYDHVYYLRPGKDAKKPFKLLQSAMTQSSQAALARFVMRDRQYTALIRATEDGLILHTLHYADEVDAQDPGLKSALSNIKLSAGELKMAGELIKAMTGEFHLEQFHDEYRDQLQALVDAKTQGKQVTNAPEPAERPTGSTINLMDALKKSLAGSTSRQADTAKPRTARRPVPARSRRRAAT